MSDLAAFARYARAYEIAFATDDWASLEEHFTEDAVRVVPAEGVLGADHRGRTAIIAGLRESVATLDRRFDARIPEILDGPWPRPDGIWMRYRLTLRRAGVPELVLEGTHLAVMRDGRIDRIEESIAAETSARVTEHLATHDAALRPPAGPPSAPPAEHQPALAEALMRSLVRSYAAAKCRQDTEGALEVCSPDFRLDAIGFGLTTRDAAEAAQQLAIFFEAFPDYNVDVEGLAVGDGAVTLWGIAHVTWRGALLGQPASGKAAAFPVACVFTFAGGLIARERFFFDGADLCRQIGAPFEAMESVLATLRTAQEAAA